MWRQAFNQLWRWTKGRQGTGYEKCLLFTTPWPIGMDVYLLRYTQGQGIPPHNDPVLGKRHYRFNWVLTQSVGGQFVCDNPLWSRGQFHFFRSDLSTHSVTPVTQGTRYVLSIGWVLPNR